MTTNKLTRDQWLTLCYIYPDTATPEMIGRVIGERGGKNASSWGRSMLNQLHKLGLVSRQGRGVYVVTRSGESALEHYQDQTP